MTVQDLITKLNNLPEISRNMVVTFPTKDQNGEYVLATVDELSIVLRDSVMAMRTVGEMSEMILILS